MSLAHCVDGRLASFLGGMAALLLLVFLPFTADAQDTPLSQTHPEAHPISAVPMAQMPSLNNQALRAQHPVSGGGPLYFAEPVETQITPPQHGTWEAGPDEQRIWRLRIRSDDARSLNLGFTRYRMPPGGRLFVYAPDRSTVHGPFTATDNESHGELWTPIIPGDELIIEVNIPADQTGELELTLGQVNHGYRSLDAAKLSGSCNVDVACSEADPWRDQVSAVGTYTLSGPSGARICSGVLVNNTAEDQTPYFLTANHCGISPNNAASMVVYWNFENSTCRPPSEAGGRGDGTLDQFNSGADLRANYSGESSGIADGPDFALVELDDPIESDVSAFYAGWDRTDTAPPRATTIHHPQGQEKRISFEEDPLSITPYEPVSSASEPTHLRVDDWNTGTTEPGSSGAPLFNPDQHVIGVLSGGFAACGNDEPDWYGRLAVAWTGGGTPETRLRDWLDPMDTNTTALDGNGFRTDTIPPATVTDFRVADISAEGITLNWTAPGDDEMTGTADAYDLRYATSPIITDDDFEAATRVATIPLPDSAGTAQTATVRNLDPETPYYFALIVRDAAGNTSGIAATEDNALILERGFTLKSPFPNPFQTTTTLQFAVNERETVTVSLYDALGRHVRTAYRETPPANTLQDVRINRRGLSSGRYFIRVVGESFATTKLVTLVR